MRHARAKVLGGCSSHNSCIAFLPPAECLDEWVTMGATGWSAAEILPLTDAAATADGVCCATCRPKIRAGQRFWRPRRRSACRPSRSTAARPSATARAGSRSTPPRTAPGCPARTPICIRSWSPRRNLEVRTGCWVSEILFDDAVAATGVRYQRPDLTGYDTVSARREVIVTAGAIDTPKLLMLSGIGPSVHLREIGIHVRVDSPGVGVEPRRPRRGPGVLGGVQADGDDVHPVVGDRAVHHGRRGRDASPT